MCIFIYALVHDSTVLAMPWSPARRSRPYRRVFSWRAGHSTKSNSKGWATTNNELLGIKLIFKIDQFFGERKLKFLCQCIFKRRVQQDFQTLIFLTNIYPRPLIQTSNYFCNQWHTHQNMQCLTSLSALLCQSWLLVDNIKPVKFNSAVLFAMLSHRFGIW